MVRLSDIFCLNSGGNSPWVDWRTVGCRIGGNLNSGSLECGWSSNWREGEGDLRLACLALWSSVTTEFGECL